MEQKRLRLCTKLSEYESLSRTSESIHCVCISVVSAHFGKMRVDKERNRGCGSDQARSRDGGDGRKV